MQKNGGEHGRTQESVFYERVKSKESKEGSGYSRRDDLYRTKAVGLFAWFGLNNRCTSVSGFQGVAGASV